MGATRYCYIDGCRQVATLILHSHPDDVLLCDEHRSVHEPDEYLPEEPCLGESCWCAEVPS
jgi:hypothetical protein